MGSEANINLKKETVKEIVDKVKNSESVILFSYQGLSVSDMNELRRSLKDVDSEVKIYKNTLTKRALEELKVDLTDFMEGPNAILFGNSLLEPIKVIADFAKKHNKLEIRVGILSGNVADVNLIKEYAEIPSKEGLLTMFASGLLQYLREFAIGVDMISKQKEE
ncbi:MAG TPA: 50S ribosomal protein L10 [Bacilli bacterium]|nr:50S ribosomal protein L10 [Bacilli bacterium]